jgi:hypothetical protein
MGVKGMRVTPDGMFPSETSHSTVMYTECPRREKLFARSVITISVPPV